LSTLNWPAAATTKLFVVGAEAAREGINATSFEDAGSIRFVGMTFPAKARPVVGSKMHPDLGPPAVLQSCPAPKPGRTEEKAPPRMAIVGRVMIGVPIPRCVVR